MNLLNSFMSVIDKFTFDLFNLNLYAISFTLSGFIFIMVCFTYLYLRFKKVHDNKIAALSYSINIGVMGFLKKWSLIFLITSFVISFFIYNTFGYHMMLSNLFGVVLSYIAVLIGLKSAHKGAGRTVISAKTNKTKAFSITFISGVISGFTFGSISLMGISILMYCIGDNLDLLNSIIGFAFGFTFSTLLIRTIGSVFAKSADISSYLLRRLYRNTKKILNLNMSYIADNIGDNINNIAGLGMDIMDSSITAIVSAIILASIIPIVDISRYISIGVTRNSLIVLPVIISLVGLLSSFVGIIFWFFISKKNLNRILDVMNIFVSFLFSVSSFALIHFLKYPRSLFIPILCGSLLGFIISKVVEIYTKGSFVDFILKYSVRGAAGNIMSGLYKACLLVTIMLSLLIAAIYISYTFSGVYGLSLASIGLISNFAFILTVGASSPICDNAHSISVMSGQNSSINKITADLDMIGNTGAIITKTLSVSASILTIIALFIVYKQEVEFYYKSQLLMDITNIHILIGLFIGISIIIALMSYVIRSVDKMIDAMLEFYATKIQDIKDNKINRIKELNSICKLHFNFYIDNIRFLSNYFINKSIKNILFPCLFVICIPIIVFMMGAELIIGVMLGSFLFGLGLSLLMYNAGGLCDNVKKVDYIKNITDKDVEINKDSILTGDIIGDYFKDAIGPTINIYIKLIFIIALLIVPLTKYKFF